MPLALIVEIGTVVAGANSYIALADAETYFLGRLRKDAWTAADTDTKNAALVTAVRTIDTMVTFNGSIVSQVQPLQWPRAYCPNPDFQLFGISYPENLGQYFASDSIPQVVKDAQCEMALALLNDEGDRTGDNEGVGLKRVRIEGAVEVEFDKTDKRPILPNIVADLLSKVGNPGGGAFQTVKLYRT